MCMCIEKILALYPRLFESLWKHNLHVYRFASIYTGKFLVPVAILGYQQRGPESPALSFHDK